MPRLNHKNIARYYSSWMEAVEPDEKLLEAVSRLRVKL
jgi:hypothetical protein